MTLWPRIVVALARFGLVALAVTACGTGSSYLIPSGTNNTLVAGWEHRFSLDWSVESEPGPTRRVRGYITSQYGESAEPVRMLAQALDSSGAIIGQRIEWVVGGVSGFQRAYFEVAQLPPAAAYRVSVWDYTLLQNPGSGWI
jgi:hypothetical protein